VNSFDAEMNTPLHLAAQNGKYVKCVYSRVKQPCEDSFCVL
jgi:ankyrin repeat protein